LTTIDQAGPARVDRGPFPSGHALTGHFHILRDFRSVVLGNTRHVFVYLPPNYHREHHRRYPVLYMQDGQNLFDPNLSFIHGQDWRLDETAQSLIEHGSIEPLVIVGIDHAGVGRAAEFTPTRDARRCEGGRADLYGRMLVQELKPWIDRHYRTRPGAPDTGLGGSSLGGLVSCYLGITRPDVFGRLAVMSPSLWWDRRHVIGLARALRAKTNTRIWLDAGTEEGRGVLQNVRILKNLLIKKGWRLGDDLRYVEAAGARHSERDWAARAGDVLRYLFPPESRA
jgi:predicted alpha/beta superfamily hydrolase